MCRMFVDALDGLMYDEHHSSGRCYLSLSKVTCLLDQFVMFVFVKKFYFKLLLSLIHYTHKTTAFKFDLLHALKNGLIISTEVI